MKIMQIKILYFRILLVAFSLSILLTFSTCLHAWLTMGVVSLTSVFHEWVLGE